MQISARNISLSYTQQGGVKQENAQKMIKDSLKNAGIELSDDDISKLSGKDISNAYFVKSFELSITQVSIQGNLSEFANNKGFINDFLNTVKNNKNDFLHLDNLTPEKAKNLISEDGYWGAKQTGERIANFVLAGAGDDIQMLKAGREGIMQGLNQANKLLGGFSKGYGDLAKDTIENALKLIDEKISKLGENIVDIKA